MLAVKKKKELKKIEEGTMLFPSCVAWYSDSNLIFLSPSRNYIFVYLLRIAEVRLTEGQDRRGPGS